MSRELLEEFHKAKRESQKLSLALQILKPETDLEGPERKELLKYLDYRRRSAAMELIRAGDLAGLRAMEVRGWLEQQHLEGYRREAGRLGEAEIWAYLCQLSDPTCRKQEGRAARGKTAIQLETDRKAQQDEAKLCGRIWKLTVKKLRMKLPGLSEALSILRFERDEKIRGLAGDGFQVFYRSGELFPAYVDSPELVARNLLHLIIHNLYLHPLLSAGKDERLWICLRYDGGAPSGRLEDTGTVPTWERIQSIAAERTAAAGAMAERRGIIPDSLQEKQRSRGA